jgi:gas vesicle protein
MLYGQSLIEARAGIFKTDVLRSLLFVAGGAAVIWLFAKKIIKAPWALAALAALILVDMWGVNLRYLNNEKDRGRFTQWEPAAEKIVTHKAGTADQTVLDMEQNLNPRVKDAIELAVSDFRKNAKQDASRRITEDEVNDVRFAALRFNTNYRVLTLQNPFNDSRVSYFHKSVGGYHGAKLKRYQELIEFRLGPELAKLQSTLQDQPSLEALRARMRSLDVLNMLNTKYIIYNPQAGPLVNEAALGSAWFVKDIVLVDNANEEIGRLEDFDAREEAIVHKRFADMVQGFESQPDQDAAIAVESHLPNYISYIYESKVPQAVVFSEMHYDAGWNAYIDGNQVPYFRTNYVLRGLIVPPGSHSIEFKFEPDAFIASSQLSTAGGLALVLLFAFAVFKNFKRDGADDDEDDFY